MTFGSLFAGIGGLDLGLERAGMRCQWQVEIDPYARRVLAKHWPDVRRHDDVRTFPPTNAGEWSVDLICGGFPCQDISNAGKRAGITGERSGLWSEYVRIVRMVRPRFVLVENVSALLVRGMGTVLGDLAALGFDAEWSVLSACQFGAPHSRERLFLFAYADRHFMRASWTGQNQGASARLPVGSPSETRPLVNWWATQPEPCGVVYGVPGVVDRLRGLGNAVVPQVAEWIGRRIMEAE